MTTFEPDDDDAVHEGLSALRVHDASTVRAERIRARCLAVLAARRREKATSAGWRRWLEPAFALGFGALYLAEAVARAMAVYAVR